MNFFERKHARRHRITVWVFEDRCLDRCLEEEIVKEEGRERRGFESSFSFQSITRLNRVIDLSPQTFPDPWIEKELSTLHPLSFQDEKRGKNFALSSAVDFKMFYFQSKGSALYKTFFEKSHRMMMNVTRARHEPSFSLLLQIINLNSVLFMLYHPMLNSLWKFLLFHPASLSESVSIPSIER